MEQIINQDSTIPSEVILSVEKIDRSSSTASTSSLALPLPEELSTSLVIRTARKMKRLKPINFSILRWNLFWLFLIWVVVALPIWLRYASNCLVTFYVILVVQCWLDLVWLLAILFSVYYLVTLHYGMKADHRLRYPQNSPKIYHLLILTIYKDDMEVIYRTVDSIAAQSEASSVIMVLAWESRTPDREQRTSLMQERYKDVFAHLLFTVHPYGLDNEVASKAANANWGLREAVKFMFVDQNHQNIDHFMVTTCDADTLFHPKYFESLTADYLVMLSKQDANIHRTIWQAPLFYNWNLDQSSFITRITGLLRTTMTMGLLIPYNVNPMSCFSFSLTLAIRGGYWHPQIFMDDVGYLLTMMIGTQQRIRIRCLPVPVRSGPTSGETWLKDMHEWYIQVRRWGLGTADNFHYFMVKFLTLPLTASIIFFIGYFLYYGVILCSASLFNAVSCFYPLICEDLKINWISNISIHNYTPTPFHILLLCGLIFPYCLYGCMFILDGVWCRYILNVKEDIFILRNIIHFLLTAPSLLMLSYVQFWSYHVLAALGKSACIHRVAGKATLANIGQTRN